MLLFGLKMGLDREIRQHLYNGYGPLKCVKRVTAICCAAAATRPGHCASKILKERFAICMIIGLLREIKIEGVSRLEGRNIGSNESLHSCSTSDRFMTIDLRA